jgi:hypothetical protein
MTLSLWKLADIVMGRMVSGTKRQTVRSLIARYQYGFERKDLPTVLRSFSGSTIVDLAHYLDRRSYDGRWM